MAKIPKSAKKEIPQKCKLCGRKFKSKEFLVSHIERVHSDEIPKDWSPSRYENYLRTGATCGHCVVCKKETDWNEATWKYCRLCNDPKCRESISKSADKNMIGKYGKTTLLNDPEQQRKMIYAKKTSGTYYWSTDKAKKYPMHYASSVELSFLEMLDSFLGVEVEDVLSPSPNNYTYKYEGKNHLYIPDVYITSINLEIELKEPADNQNMHPKIQAIDKVKERLKDELMESIDYVNYIKINGTDYREFFDYFTYLKNLPDKPVSVEASLESAINDISISDDDLQEAWMEMLQEPVTEKKKEIDLIDLTNSLSELAHSTKDMLDPGLNYNRTIDKFEQDIKGCTSLKGAKLIKHNMVMFKKELKKVLSDKDQKELHFEAKKAIKKIDDLCNEIDKKIDRFDRLGGYNFITDGYDKKAWYRPVKESLITGVKNDITYKPVFVFLSYTGTAMAKLIKSITDGTYSHASLSLDTNMENMCSFNGHGFVSEDINLKEFSNSNGEYALYMYMAPQVEYETIENIIKQFNENANKMKYSIIGLFNYLIGKETKYKSEWFCSEFVSYVLSEANPKLFKRHYSLYSPDDLTNTRKFIKVSSGKTLNYDANTIDRQIRKILNRKGFDHVIIEH